MNEKKICPLLASHKPAYMAQCEEYGCGFYVRAHQYENSAGKRIVCGEGCAIRVIAEALQRKTCEA